MNQKCMKFPSMGGSKDCGTSRGYRRQSIFGRKWEEFSFGQEKFEVEIPSMEEKWLWRFRIQDHLLEEKTKQNSVRFQLREGGREICSLQRRMRGNEKVTLALESHRLEFVSSLCHILFV